MSAPRNTLWGKVRKLGRRLVWKHKAAWRAVTKLASAALCGTTLPPLCPRCDHPMDEGKTPGTWVCPYGGDERKELPVKMRVVE